MVIGWNTTKTAAGYSWRVYSVAHAVPTVTLVSGEATTRARAVGAAKRACRALRAKHALAELVKA